MVTGGSTAEAAVILVDARKGVLQQTRRHTYIAHLLGVRHILVAINKMDLVGYDETVFQRIRDDFKAFAAPLAIPDLRFIPVSALRGDLIAERGTGMPWYKGQTLLAALEDIEVGEAADALPVRFPVQLVVRPGAGTDFRGYAGRVESGTLERGDELVALPSGRRSRVKDIVFQGRPGSGATAGDSVTVVLADDIDLSRGDMLVAPESIPQSSKSLNARICWLSETPLDRSARFVLKHTTKTVKAKLASIHDRVDINTLKREPAPQDLAMNDIAHVQLTLAQPVFVDAYDANRATGSFILVDEVTNHTLAAGMVEL
jgi:sulfate adenylyltransferase subunit 1